MTVKVYFWQCGIIRGATGLGEDKIQVSEMGSFILQVEKFLFQFLVSAGDSLNCCMSRSQAFCVTPK